MKRFFAALLSAILCLSFLATGIPAYAQESISARTTLSGSAWAKISNIEIAIRSLNGLTVPGGGYFSFNDVVGPRSKAYGYQTAANGRGAKVTGGGVAQVASALWLAIKDSDDIVILEKSTYGKRYNQRYVADAADAILTDYASGKDFRFRYTGDTSLTIYAYVEDGCLYCDVYES